MLETHNLTYQKGSKYLLRDVSLQFPPGLYAILGPNGSGKTTFFKLIKNIWTPTTGIVLWKKKNIHQASRKDLSKTIAFVPQNPQCHFPFTVEEFILMARYPHQSAPNKNLWSRVLATTDIAPFLQSPLHALSGGERQRVYIARALLTESPVLLLDEPTSHLDTDHSSTIWQMLRDLALEGKIVIVSTHDLTAAHTHCHQTHSFHAGSMNQSH